MRRRAFCGSVAALALAHGVAAAAVKMTSAELVEVFLVADFSEFKRQIDELASLGLEAGGVPESILQQLRSLVDDLSGELGFETTFTATGAREQVIKFRFREGGQFDSCIAALRALRDRGGIGHGGSFS